ncbi:MAG: Ser-Thr-rich GPI-anchored membrane family protein [Candidatus Cloacimonadaceae bacterium]
MKKMFLMLLFLMAVLLLNAQLGTITVLSPNGGENWYTGNIYPITWTYTNLTGNVYIQLVPYSNTSTQPALTIATNVPIADGSYAWSIPATLTINGSYKIRIVWLSVLDVYIADESDGPFTISSGYVTPSITVTSPNGGENWQIGQTYPITWNYTNLTGTVRIELVSPSMTPIANIIAETPIEDGVYNWTIPNSVMPASFYRIHIVWNSILTVYFGDLSDADFTISAGAIVPSVTVLQPNGGEVWMRGRTYQIRWQSVNPSAAGSVEIALFNGLSSGTVPIIIAPNTPDDGYFAWTIPRNIVTGRRYKIRIRQLYYNGAMDFSDGYFAILGLPVISIVDVIKEAGKISFNIESESAEPVSVKIYNLKGQVVKNLVSAELISGSKTITWNGLNDSGRKVQNGIYFVKLESGKDIVTRKFILR